MSQNKQKKNKNLQTLLKKRKTIYKNLLSLVYNAQSGHIGSSLSCLDIIFFLFAFEMKKEDKFILSKGHAVPSLYTVLHFIGKLSNKSLQTFLQDGTKLPAHPSIHLDSLIPFPSGSLGHGLSLSCGIAQGLQLKKKKGRMFCLISDGECNEGQVWEAVQYASQKKLNNLIVLIDSNKIQATGQTTDVLGNSATKEKWEAFGFKVYECNGNNIKEIGNTFKKISARNYKKPVVIILNTIKGYGVSFMENTISWHYNHLTESQYNQAVTEIEKNI